jgi:transposase
MGSGSASSLGAPACIARRFVAHSRALIRRSTPGRRRPSKLDPFKDEVHRLLKDEPRLPAVRIRELLQPLGYAGGETILKEHVREVRPFFLPARTYQRTVYLPGELAQCDLWEPRAELPVGFGQHRRGYVVTCALGYSKVSAGTLIFSKEAPDILAGLLRCLVRIGGLPTRLVWDREGALHAGDGRPTEAFASFCGQLAIGWQFCAPRDLRRKGSSSGATGTSRRASSPRGSSPDRSTSKTSSTAGTPSARTFGSIAASGLDRSSGSPRSSSGRCPRRCRIWIAVRSCACRRSRTRGSIPPTIRSIPASSAGGSTTGTCGAPRRSVRIRACASAVTVR